MSRHQVTRVEALVWVLTWAPRGTSSLPLSEQDISQSPCSTTVQPLVSSATLARPSRCSLLRPSLILTTELGYSIRNHRLTKTRDWCDVSILSGVTCQCRPGPSPSLLLGCSCPPQSEHRHCLGANLPTSAAAPQHNATLLCSCQQPRATASTAYCSVLYCTVLHRTALYCALYQKYENLGQNIILCFNLLTTAATPHRHLPPLNCGRHGERMSHYIYHKNIKQPLCLQSWWSRCLSFSQRI